MPLILWVSFVINDCGLIVSHKVEFRVSPWCSVTGHETSDHWIYGVHSHPASICLKGLSFFI